MADVVVCWFRPNCWLGWL